MFAIFEKYPDIVALLSKKKDGAMKFSDENKERFLKKLGIDNKSTIGAGLVHGDNIEIVSNREAGEKIEKTDGLVIADKGLFLTLTIADCLPIFLYDPEKEIIGLVHGGWRSLAKNILTKAIEKMPSFPKDILIGIGPGISQCHFEVKEDLLVEFRPYLKDALLRQNAKFFLDLKKIAKIQLVHSGVREENIEISPECTFCLANKYFSHRREKLDPLKTMIAVIGRR